MSNEVHSIWLMAGPADEFFLAGLIADLARRFGTPVFTPHLTIAGDKVDPPAALEAAIAAAAADVAAFVEQITGVETSAAHFRSFYARLPVSTPLVALKQRLDAGQGNGFMPHVSLLYGTVAPGPKSAAADEFRRLLAGRTIAFDRLCLVRSGQDIPIDEWAIVSTVRLAQA